MSEKIEYETVTITVPKPILKFLQAQTNCYEFSSVESLIEYDLVESVRAEMEAMNGEDLIKMLDFGPIFWEILGDKNYEPKKNAPKSKPVLTIT